MANSNPNNLIHFRNSYQKIDNALKNKEIQL